MASGRTGKSATGNGDHFGRRSRSCEPPRFGLDVILLPAANRFCFKEVFNTQVAVLPTNA